MTLPLDRRTACRHARGSHGRWEHAAGTGQPRAGTLSADPSCTNLPSGRRTGPAAGGLSRCGRISPRLTRSPVFSQDSQWAGLLRIVALTSAAQCPNTIAVSPSTGTGAVISHTWWRLGVERSRTAARRMRRCDAVAEGGRQAAQERRGCRPVGRAFCVAQQPPGAVVTHARRSAFRAPGRGGRRR